MFRSAAAAVKILCWYYNEFMCLAKKVQYAKLDSKDSKILML